MEKEEKKEGEVTYVATYYCKNDSDYCKEMSMLPMFHVIFKSSLKGAELVKFVAEAVPDEDEDFYFASILAQLDKRKGIFVGGMKLIKLKDKID